MSKTLTVTVECQFYGEDEVEQLEVLTKLRDAIVAVVSLCDLSVGTFVKSEIVEPAAPVQR